MAAVRDARVLEELRARIAAVASSGRQRACLPFGVVEIDAALPGGGLSRAALHEVVGAEPGLAQGAAAILFAAGILARAKGPVLWCVIRHELFAPGLAGAGLHPDRVLYAEVDEEAAALAIAEEALRMPGLGGVVAEVARLGLTPSRRLQLAAEASGVLGLVVRRRRRGGPEPIGGSAAATRWRVTTLPSAPLADGVPGVGRARWRLELVRCRGGEAPHAWIVEAPDGAGRLRLVAELADRSAAPAARRAAAG